MTATLPRIDNYYDLVDALTVLNPGVKFEATSSKKGLIFSSKPCYSLKVPAPFYWDPKYGLTNKNHTKDGIFISVDIVMM